MRPTPPLTCASSHRHSHAYALLFRFSGKALKPKSRSNHRKEALGIKTGRMKSSDAGVAAVVDNFKKSILSGGRPDTAVQVLHYEIPRLAFH